MAISTSISIIDTRKNGVVDGETNLRYPPVISTLPANQNYTVNQSNHIHIPRGVFASPHSNFSENTHKCR